MAGTVRTPHLTPPAADRFRANAEVGPRHIPSTTPTPATPLLQSPHPPSGLRCCDDVPPPGGAAGWFYGATRADGAHELRTVLLPA